jgi:hypothetical protein
MWGGMGVINCVMSLTILPSRVFEPSVLIVNWYSSFTEKIFSFTHRNIIAAMEKMKKQTIEPSNNASLNVSSDKRKLIAKIKRQPASIMAYKAAKP